jgi:putative inorganic carbon (hco3(-)) transporter
MSSLLEPAASSAPPTDLLEVPPVTEVAPPSCDEAAVPAQSPLGFALFIVLNAVLLIRPEEIVPALDGLHLYEIVILACVLFSLRPMLGQLSAGVLKTRPINLCVLGMLPAVVLSLLVHFRFGDAYTAGFEFAKVVVYFLLFISLVSTLSRLRWFLFWLTVFVAVLAGVALLQFHGVVNIPGLEECQQRMLDEDGELDVIVRLVSVGIYNDPNDLCLILSFGMFVCIYWMGERRFGPARFLWVLPLGVFGYALMLTNSRGGLIGLLGGTVVLFQARFGWKKAIPLIAVALPVMLFLFSGRQTSVDLSDSEDSAQARIQLWREGLELFKGAPLFGIGKGEYAEEALQVAHNSFVHCFTELGFFGGTLFTGAFFLSAWCLYRAGSAGQGVVDARVTRLQPFLLAGLMAYILGMLSLSRAYIVPTYMMLGLTSAFTALPAVTGRVSLPGMSRRLLLILVGVAILTLGGHSLFVRIFAR